MANYLADPSGAVLQIAQTLAGAPTIGAFIDATLDELARIMHSPLVSFSEIDLITRTAATSLRPYRQTHSIAVDRLVDILDEHPLFNWYTSQPDWSPTRISDHMSWPDLIKTQLYEKVLVPVGGQHMLLILVAPPVEGCWIYFCVNRPDLDFTDHELEFATRLQPALVALYRRFSGPAIRTLEPPPDLTRRELTVLKLLAAGLSADAIGNRLGCTAKTVRKHLQNLYGKLNTHDRLTTVMRARSLGLVREDDLSTEFTWNIRTDISVPRPGEWLPT